MKKNFFINSCIISLLIISICTSACAFENENIGNSSDAEEGTISTAVITEAQYVNDLLTANEMELKEMGVSDEIIPLILSGEYENNIRDEINYRATLSDDDLRDLYSYSDEQIATLRSFSDDDSVYDMLVALDTKVTCEISKVFYRYYTSSDITHFVLAAEWEWNSQPTYTGIEDGEIVGFGWNNDYSLGMEQLMSWNYHYIHYAGGNPHNISYALVENEENNSCHVFGLNEDGGWAESGSAVVSLQAAGLKTNSKFSMKYGHSEVFLGTPSLSVPPGISFGFSNVTTTYSPVNGVYTALSPDTYTSPIEPTSTSLPALAFMNEFTQCEPVF